MSGSNDWAIDDLKWNVSMLRDMRSRLILNTPYQRQLVWTHGIKQRLIWCMLRGQDIPKFYFHALRDDGLWNVVDGQQRIDSILKFLDDKLPLSKDTPPVKGYEVANLRFSELPNQLKNNFLNCKIDIKEIVSDDMTRVIDQFLDLQRGKPLNGQEKRQAPPTFVKEFVYKLGEHPFIGIARINKRRYAQYETISRVLIWEYNDQICDSSGGILDRFYITNAVESWQSGQWKRIFSRMTRTLDKMMEIFDKDYETLRSAVPFMLTYWLVRELVEKYVMPPNWQSSFLEWWLNFWREQERLKKLGDGINFTESTNAGKQNIERFRAMSASYFKNNPNLITKDEKRIFSDDERRILFLEAKGRCQWVDAEGNVCDKPLSPGEWDADHIEPHTNGGRTSVDNGRVVCKWRNRSNGNPEFVCPLKCQEVE